MTFARLCVEARRISLRNLDSQIQTLHSGFCPELWICNPRLQTPNSGFRIQIQNGTLRIHPFNRFWTGQSGPWIQSRNPDLQMQIPNSEFCSLKLVSDGRLGPRCPGSEPVAADFAELGDPKACPRKAQRQRATGVTFAGWDVPRAGDGLEMQPRRHQRWTSPSLVEFWSRHWDSPANVHTDWTSGGRAAPFFFFASGGSAKGSNGSIGGCVFLKMHVFTFFIFFLFFLDSMPLLTARIAQWNLQRTARTSPGALGWAVSFCSNRGHRSFFLRPGCRLRAQTGQ